MKREWVWRLRNHLAALLVVSVTLTFLLVGAAALVGRVPVIEQNSRDEMVQDVQELQARVEDSLGYLQFRLVQIGGSTQWAPAELLGQALDGGIGDDRSFHAIYLVSTQGEVLQAGLAPDLRHMAGDLIGSDLSNSPLYRAALQHPGVVWSGSYLSALTGVPTVGVATRAGPRVLMGELPLSYMLRLVERSAGRRSSDIWLVDRSGEILADTQGGIHVGKLNVLNLPVLQAALRGDAPVDRFRFEGRDHHASVAKSEVLDWYFVGSARAGFDSPDVRDMITGTLVAFGGCVVTGLLIAPFWSARLARPLQRIVDRAAQITAGQDSGAAWPRGAVAEFNQLSDDLQRMAVTLRERERKSQAIFNASPMPMSVVDEDAGGSLQDVNDAWCREYRRRRDDVIGRVAMDIGLLSEHQNQELALHWQDDRLSGELWLRRGDGSAALAQVFAHRTTVDGRRLTIWATVDIGPMRRIESELRLLNQELESRVRQRTEALGRSNQELLQTLEQLRLMQAGLVQAEKMAALGALVAGVAHELNTPLGNSVMSVSAMADATRRFKQAVQTGLRRAELQAWIDSVEQGTDITGRNLRRAAELVQNFKQVAVDQTSAQRRRFELHEVVHEMVVSLRPSFSHTPYRIEVDVPATGLGLDSYPGALGQAIGNLIQNAVLHGFDGRDHGTVRVSAEAAGDAGIVMRVQDDGHGIAAEVLPRIFDPFVTTKMGQGGTGLGLHISYNAVVNLLGGALTVHSVQGQGTCFEIMLPAQAPRSPAENAAGTRVVREEREAGA